MRSAALSISLVLSLALNSLASAQQSATTPDAQQLETRVSSHNPSTLAAGTAVHLRFVRAVTSSLVLAGEKVSLEAIDPVVVGDLVAIQPHALAEATVTVAQANRSLGGGGRLELKIESVRLADGESAALRAVRAAKGGDRTGLAVLGTAGISYWAASPLTYLFYVKGKSAVIPAGSQITAYVAEETPLDASKFQAAVTATASSKDAAK